MKANSAVIEPPPPPPPPPPRDTYLRYLLTRLCVNGSGAHQNAFYTHIRIAIMSIVSFSERRKMILLIFSRVCFLHYPGRKPVGITRFSVMASGFPFCLQPNRLETRPFCGGNCISKELIADEVGNQHPAV